MNKIKFCHIIDASTANPLLFNSIKFSNREIFEYTVITLAPVGALQEQLAELGVESFSLEHTSRKQSLSSFLKLLRYFRQSRTQIVQAHLMDSSIIGLAAAKLAGVAVRIFSGHHSHEIPLYKRPFLSFVDSFTPRFVANHTIAPSEQMKSTFVHDLKVEESKVAVLYHGFDLEDWRRKALNADVVRRELGLEGKTVLGAVGRLFWVKNFENLINSFAEVAENRDDLVLLIVGSGNGVGLKTLIDRLGFRGKIILTGPRSDIPSVMACFDIFVHSSRAESFGMVFVEAFSLGKPVVSTRVGIAPELVKNGINGFLADSPDIKPLAEAIGKMIDSRESWSGMEDASIAASEAFSIFKTQELCDKKYLEWIQKK